MRGTQFAELGSIVVVVEDTRFAKAAKQLGRSTASISHTVWMLEDARLLNWTTQRVAQTPVGRPRLSYSERMPAPQGGLGLPPT
jgi:DNA-binding transcriptional LysR family regulator